VFIRVLAEALSWHAVFTLPRLIPRLTLVSSARQLSLSSPPNSISAPYTGIFLLSKSPEKTRIEFQMEAERKSPERNIQEWHISSFVTGAVAIQALV